MPDTDRGEAVYQVAGIVGSLRSGSYNRALLRAAMELTSTGMSIAPLALDEIPLYNFDVEQDGDPAPVSPTLTRC